VLNVIKLSCFVIYARANESSGVVKTDYSK
jgi:hypothetical protein